jgi:stage II sporulation protein M
VNIKKAASAISKHFECNYCLYIISFLFITIGIILGIYTVKYMGQIDKNNLAGCISDFSKSYKTFNINYRIIFFDAVKNQISIILAIWFLGLTMIGIPVILIINFSKGFTIGFSAGFFINTYGVKGIILALLAILPQNVIYLFCIVFCSVIAMEFSLMLIKDNFRKNWTHNINIKVSSYSFIFIISSIIMILGFLYETYVTTNAVKLIVSNIGAKFI